MKKTHQKSEGKAKRKLIQKIQWVKITHFQKIGSLILGIPIVKGSIAFKFSYPE